jgi:hypothetical protein
MPAPRPVVPALVVMLAIVALVAVPVACAVYFITLKLPAIRAAMPH